MRITGRGICDARGSASQAGTGVSHIPSRACSLRLPAGQASGSGEQPVRLWRKGLPAAGALCEHRPVMGGEGGAIFSEPW
ncbi:hypothetical protein A2303_07160 [Candidatus Falkowbacteria bacterium RIFOXYB2_FULL_47_14]|uniref:Uncharacterized protein n=1 Tax=Candidatus Falkowbacteria bacterium RIFOXYA2_FULL_47_19 TaxID=1797994 RepID=A0A1F5SGR4_9BACT|nr:MAG: hypothetical protein A2227_00905 [Candidatus Falkowbacteria bacterium RIFOXYA2_FULL_47_19]OGF34928.1 MAG: hypothetical protein A2468_06865 [Candidatus Falkowbacteria bacterium RIFOXYC2_FULL_46_15]OGF43643.1 MAG: hypothetical protein A2303_07160 [Candidatus Falkowbacteria bacterium RIFOXYB2_FULL_47_14]